MTRAGEAVWRWRRAGTGAFGLRQCYRLGMAGRGGHGGGFWGRLARRATVLALLLGGLGASASLASTTRPMRLAVSGQTREALLVLPDDAPGPRPVVIALHGAWQTAQSFRDYVGLDAAASSHGFAVVYPQGIGRTWNDGRPAAMRLKAMLQPGDDEAFLVLLAHKLVAEGVADPTRIYLAGISNGGFMVQKMACHQAQLFAAYVSIMATAPANYRQECHPARPVPILFIHGTADSVIAYDGFWTPVGATLSAPDSAALYARLNGCGPAQSRPLPNLDPYDGTTVVEKSWPTCDAGAQVELMTVQMGGHQSPARVDTKPDVATPFLGLRSRDIDAGEEIWRFVSAFSLAPPPGGPGGVGMPAGAGGTVAGPSAGLPGRVPAGGLAVNPAYGNRAGVAAPAASGLAAAPLPRPSPLRAARGPEPAPTAQPEAASAPTSRLW